MMKKHKLRLYTPVVGFTSDRIVMVDLDRMDETEAVTICQYAVKVRKLGGYLLLRSSRGNYQAVFDRYVKWKEVMRILFGMVWKHRELPKLRGWCIMQAVKGSCTLRISNKGRKAPPVVIARVGTQDRAIKEYLEVKKIFERRKR
jgi:hypothetical protein